MHSHGETWLAVVHGAKKWFVYPPGFSPPLVTEQNLNPLIPSALWVNLTQSGFAKLPKPPMNHDFQSCPRGSSSGDGNCVGVGYRPLQCVQEKGQIVFLPKGWSHQTINIGETIAVGGQAVLPASDRFLQIISTSIHCNYSPLANSNSYSGMRKLH